MIGQLVAVNTDILRASETRSKRNAEIALASLSLITEVSSWQQDDDATILTKVSCFLEEKENFVIFFLVFVLFKIYIFFLFDYFFKI